MLSFFRTYAPYQYVTLLALLALVRLPLLISPLPLLIPELNWLLVGEQMNQGHLLYRDIWDSVSPLSALVYWFLHAVFGRSQLSFQIAATVVSAFQVAYFNYLTNTRNVYRERNFWPGLLYGLFLHLSFDCLTLSPALLTTTFLLLAFGTVIRQMERWGATDEVFEAGLYLGLATLCYLPSAVFMLWASVSLLLFTGATFRQHLLALFGFVFPIAVTVLFYYFYESLDEFSRNLLAAVFRVRQYPLSDFGAVLTALAVPLIVAVLGFLRLLRTSNSNFQQRCQQIMMLWFIAALLTVPLAPFLAPMVFLPFMPVLAFFAVFYFETFRRFWQAEIAFLVMLGLLLIVFYQGALGIIPGVDVGQLTKLRVKPSPLPGNIEHQKILIIGEDLSAYRQNLPATPYLNWDLARYDLENLDNYEAVISTYNHFRADPPNYIIDRENVIPKLFQRAPALAARYEKTAEAGVYKRRKQ